MTAPLLEFSGIEKAFFGVKVLKGVSLAVGRQGAVGLVGENGAGKSTLMNILSGNLAPDAGVIRFDGSAFSPKSPADATRHGIAFIHQELNLFPNLTIAENLFLTSFPRMRSMPFIDRNLTYSRTRHWLLEVGLSASPDRLVGSLSAGERQLVEIAKALSIDARLVIFDEPTTSLSAREIDHLFALIGRLRARGIGMIYISHVLAEVFRLCADIVVLRDGEVAASGPAESFSLEKLVSHMIGRAVTQAFPERTSAPSNAPLLEVRNLRQAGEISEISFTLHRGEVLGLAGLMGAGRSELARTLFGLDACSQGTVAIEGKELHRWRPRDLVGQGVAFLTEDRQAEGLCLDAAVSENLVLASLREHGRGLLRWIDVTSLGGAVARVRGTVSLDPKTRDSQPVRSLSGGNQQKVVLGKWLLQRPRVLLLDEPTRGIDVGAKFEIYRLIRELAENGAGILLIASELEELIGLCDRILVMRSGEIVDELARPEFDRTRIMRSALGVLEREDV